MMPAIASQKRRAVIRIIGVAIVVALGCGVHPGPAAADSINLTVPNESALTPGLIYATVTWNVTGTTVNFTVDPNGAVLGTGRNFGVQAFFFNTNLTLAASDFTLPSSWGVSSGQNADGFGKFGIETSGTGSTRQDPLSFSITNSSISSTSQFFLLSSLPAGNGQGHFAAHIAGFPDADPGSGTVTSSYFRDGNTPGGGTAPIPSSLLLLGTGLGVLAAFRRSNR